MGLRFLKNLLTWDSVLLEEGRGEGTGVMLGSWREVKNGSGEGVDWDEGISIRIH